MRIEQSMADYRSGRLTDHMLSHAVRLMLGSSC